MIKKRCLFCERRANSREHVWPQWLTRIIKKLPGEDKTLWAIQANQFGQTNRWKRSTPEIVIKRVCKARCNEGWMSDLEKTSERILRPMINGEETILTGPQQGIIAVWMIKCAMVLDSMYPGVKFYEESERFHFRKTFRPPGVLRFFLGHYSGRDCSGFTDHRILDNGQSVPYGQSYILTMAFGRLVLQLCNTKFTQLANVVGVEHRIIPGSWSTIDMAYPFPGSLKWPPSGPSFNDSERRLDAFSERFRSPRRE